ncbi:hypothetical protein N1851_033586 [Merluccius polli]|uniref:Uncharacterized protein n=1 Tax=Merluccius polli TaxID=89951 RepID=A0AA47M134_MERPO|nr:hypothetical protein N1851_033586 [Merluccius polli]
MDAVDSALRADAVVGMRTSCVSSVPTSGLVPGVNVTLRCSLLTFYGYGGCSYTDFQGVTLKWKDDIQQDSKPVIQSGSKCDVLLTVTIQRDITFSCQALVNDRVQSTLEVPVLLPGLKGMTSLSLSHTTCAVNTVGACVLILTRMIGSMFILSPHRSGKTPSHSRKQRSM